MKPFPKYWPAFLFLGIVTAYFFIDRPLCEFVYQHELSQHLMTFLKQYLHLPLFINEHSLLQHSCLLSHLIDWPPMMSGISPFLLLLGVLLKPGRAKNLLLLMGISILLTFVFKNDLKWIFSRNWPVTWTNNNLSWISNHAYGFQWFLGKPFQGDDTTGSFPSGHTAIAFATLLPVGLIFRKTLPYCLLIASLEGLAMLLFDYHFLSDVLAGALVGIACPLAVRKILSSEKIA
jgi:membrane-associated phospholipid phosphatase